MSSLFWFRPVFMAELLIAESFFAKKLVPRKGLAWRLPLSILFCIGIAFAIPYKINNGLYLSFMFIMLFAVTVIAGMFIFDESFKAVLFCAIASYTVQHISSEVCSAFDSIITTVTDWKFDLYDIYTPVSQQTDGIYIVISHLILYVWIYLISYKFIVPKVDKSRILHTRNNIILWLFVLIVLVDVVFGAVILRLFPASALTVLGRIPNMVIRLILHAYNILCCLLAVILIIELPRRSSMESELAIVKQLYHNKQEQYASTKKNIELINIKAHDLKHSLTATADDAEEIKAMVDIYDSTYKTENEALNIVLMEKSLECKNENINLSVVADASRLEFMRDSDVYALFGNILDNAIEAVRKVGKDDGRVIGLSIKKVNNFLIINSFNQYSGEIQLVGGFPKTTKHETAYHGYGLKSVKYIVQKYGGEMAIEIKELFNISITFPINK